MTSMFLNGFSCLNIQYTRRNYINRCMHFLAFVTVQNILLASGATARRYAFRQEPQDDERLRDERDNRCTPSLLAGSGKLQRARSRLYRSQILQVNMRWKALAEIYTMHSFAQL